MKPTAPILAVLLLLCAGAAPGAAPPPSGGGHGQGQNETASADQPVSGAPEQVPSKPSPAVERRVIAYYFHGNFRCNKCRAMEAYAGEVMKEDFGAEQKDGRLEWKVVNVDESRNSHFVGDYKLVTRSLVLVEVVDGQPGKWKNLDKIWDHVGNELRFKDYVRSETRDFLRVTRD